MATYWLDRLYRQLCRYAAGAVRRTRTSRRRARPTVEALESRTVLSTVRFSAATYSVNENELRATITVTRTSAAGTESVQYATSSTTATAASPAPGGAGGDYFAASNLVVFNPGQTSRTFFVNILEDAVEDPNETINLTLSNPGTGTVIGTPSTAVLTVADNPGFDPSPQAQWSLELLNRMRINPQGELSLLINSTDPGVQGAIAFWQVNLTVLAQQWAPLVPAQPLAFHANLYNAAVGHTLQMLQHDTQSHQLPGEPALGPRVSAAGYPFSSVGENIFAFTTNMFHAHAGFAIDWGDGPDGIQDPPGHRITMMNNTFREIGISVMHDLPTSAETGPLLITQDLGTRSGFGNPYLLGVVFNDANSDGYYTAGEGMAGVNVSAVGPGGTTSRTTTTSGGYQMQVAAGTYNVTFSGGGLSGSVTRTVTVGPANTKLDVVNGQNPGTLQFAAPTYSFSESAGTVVVTVTRTGGSGGTVAVNYATGGGSATAGQDYTPASGTLFFRPGEVTKEISLTILNDSNPESNETFNLVLSNPTNGATLGTNSTAVVTIVDNDLHPPTISNIFDQTTFQDTPVGPLAFTIGDLDTPIEQLTVSAVSSDTTVLPNANIVLGGSGASRNVTLTPAPGQLGSATVTITVSDGQASTPMSFTLNVIPGTLRVTSFTSNPSGFTVVMNRAFEASVLNLINTQSGPGPVDVTITGASTGVVRGSLVVRSPSTGFTFVRTGGVLPADTYTVTLRSAADGFRLPTGGLLDGNGDGTAGDNYTTTFVVSASTAALVSIPEVMRGPGQPVDVSGLGTQLPLRLNAGTSVTSVSLTLRYNAALLGISAASTPIAGATVMLNTSTPGQAVITFNSSAGVPPGPIDFVLLTATVPDNAPYTSKHLLDITNLTVSGPGGAIPSRDDDGLHVVGYFGDTTGNAGYSSADATQALRVSVGLDSGFSAYQLADPVIIADINGNGVVNSTDTTRILQEALGIDRPEIPALPGVLPPIVPGGPDPLLSLPKGLRVRPGGVLVVPVNLDPSEGLASADLALSFDASLLEVVDVQRGKLTSDFDLFAVNHDAEAGTLRVALGRSAGAITGRGNGSVLLITFRIKPDAVAGRTILNLRQEVGTTLTQLNEGGLDLIPDPSNEAGDRLDGELTIRGRAVRQRLARDLVFASGPRFDQASEIVRAMVNPRSKDLAGNRRAGS